MSCCVGFIGAKKIIGEIVNKYHHDDHKIFVVNRVANTGIAYKITLGVTVKPDVDKNTQMFEDFIKLHARTDVCIKMINTDINWKDERLVDLFLLEIESEVVK